MGGVTLSAELPLEFKGLTKVPGEAYQFQIINKDTQFKKWLEVGQRTGDYKLTKYKKQDNAHTLYFEDGEGQVATIELSESEYKGPTTNGSREYESTQLRFRNGLYYVDGEEEPITGVVVKKYPNMKDWYRRGYKDGKKHGQTIEWFPDGEKKYEMFYEDNQRTGIWTYWDQNGKITTKREYENNQFKRNLPLN